MTERPLPPKPIPIQIDEGAVLPVNNLRIPMPSVKPPKPAAPSQAPKK